VFHFEGLSLHYVDPRRFGILCAYAAQSLGESKELSLLGPDPLEPQFTVEYLTAELKASRRDLKGFLLDQTRIAGLGNIYACEACFLAGLRPRRRTDRLSASSARALHQAILQTLHDGIQNRGTSFSDYVDADGEIGSNQEALWVYGREGEACRRCGTRIKRLVQGARSSFYCPTCQR
jgi:formamidopyrimidine-DNA glycosylase